MNLFESSFDGSINLLPFDGTVNYYGVILKSDEAKFYYTTLLDSIEWKNDEAIIFGKKYITKRKVAWYGDRPYQYAYSNITKNALPWTKELLQLKNIVEKESGEQYNSCLLNLYHNGEEGMAWHSDAEKDLKFSFKHKENKETVSVLLENGSLLVMKDQTQSFWLHRLPPTKKIFQPRINLTFRTIIE